MVAALMEELSFRSKRVITRETYDQLVDLKTIHCCVTNGDVLYPLLDLDFFIQESSGAASCL